jgi:hypothetical protein
MAMPHTLRERFWHDVQYCGFEACISGALHQSANAVLHVTCDLSEEYARNCVTLFNKLRARDVMIKARCFALTFAEDERHAGLQAADMIAYCSRAEHTEREPQPIVQQIIEILRTKDRKVGALVYRADGDGPGSGELRGL